MPLWLKIIGANAVIVAAVVISARMAARDGVSERSLVAGVLAALVLSVAINVTLVLIALRPLRTLEETAARVWRGDVKARVPFSLLADRDIARVGHTLNLLVDALTEDRTRSRRLASQIIRQAELDQSRIARELHESAAQRLAAQVLQISAIARATNEPETRDRLEEVRVLSAETLEQLRALAETMYPRVLDDLGLPAAIDRLARLARERYHCPVRTTLELDEPLSLDTASVLYSVVQEAINSAVQFGNATRIHVALTTKHGRAELVVQHDGVVSEEHGGSFAVRQRVALADGEYHVRQSPEEGTHVSTSVPLAPSIYSAEHSDQDTRQLSARQ
ncbi:MAG: histidine kinase [Gemmatimonadota bacterium]|nr:histidine kinase [Gemmatimonadota bacterium]